jgi:hypothetical protein
MSTVLTITPFRNVHDIDVKSTKGRAFVIDIYKSVFGTYDSTVTVLDRVSNPPGSWLYNTQPATASANDNFKSALELIQKYLAAKDSTDSISDIHNPCNCPFVSEIDQNFIASGLGIGKKVRVN